MWDPRLIHKMATSTRWDPGLIHNIQVKAIADSIRKNTVHKPTRIEGYEQLNWVLLDYIDVIVHIFKTTERNYYNLEKLWADAPKTEYNDDHFTAANPSTN